MIEDQLVRIRRFLRDPNAKIWSNDLLINIYNDIQQEIQNRVNLLEGVTVIKVPPSYRWSYLYDWEYAYLPTTETGFYQALKQHQQATQVYCFEWELQQVWEITPDVNASGSQFFHPWEAWCLAPDDTIKIRFPVDYRDTRFIAYDKDPVDYKEEREIQVNDSSYLTTSGTPYSYYRPDELDNSFVLYPRPEAANWSDGDGVAQFSDEGTVSEETGFSIRRTYSTFSTLNGIDLDIPLLDDNVFLVYSVSPRDVELTDVSAFPDYLAKYIEYGVLSRAYRANTDGRIKSLASFWDNRYEYGVMAIKRFMLKRRTDRNYVLGKKMATRRNKHPRLPSTYPNVYSF